MEKSAIELLAEAMQKHKSKRQNDFNNLIALCVLSLCLSESTVKEIDSFIEVSGAGIDKSLNKSEKIDAILVFYGLKESE